MPSPSSARSWASRRSEPVPVTFTGSVTLRCKMTACDSEVILHATGTQPNEVPSVSCKRHGKMVLEV